MNNKQVAAKRYREKIHLNDRRSIDIDIHADIGDH